jgi:hypothetical protein
VSFGVCRLGRVVDKDFGSLHVCLLFSVQFSTRTSAWTLVHENSTRYRVRQSTVRELVREWGVTSFPSNTDLALLAQSILFGLIARIAVGIGGAVTQKPRNPNTQRHRDTETQRHRDTETQRHRDTETQRRNNPATQQPSVPGKRNPEINVQFFLKPTPVQCRCRRNPSPRVKVARGKTRSQPRRR